MADVVLSLLEAWQGRTPLRGGTAPVMLWQKTPFAPVAMVYVRVETTEVSQMYGIHAYHLLACDAPGLDHMWYEAPTAYKMSNEHVPLEHGSHAETLLPLLPLILLIVEGTVLLVLLSILTRIIQCEDVFFLQSVVESRESNGSAEVSGKGVVSNKPKSVGEKA